MTDPFVHTSSHSTGQKHPSFERRKAPVETEGSPEDQLSQQSRFFLQWKQRGLFSAGSILIFTFVHRRLVCDVRERPTPTLPLDP